MVAVNTRHSILMRLRDSTDVEAWETFEALYRNVILRTALNHGLQHADALDVTQCVLLKLHDAISDYQPDPDRARFRTWLHTVTRHAAVDFLRKRRPSDANGVSSVLRNVAQPGNAEPWSDECLEAEYRRQVLRHACERAREEFSDDAWQAFAQTFLHGRDVTQLANEMNKSPGAIYASRARILQRVRQLAHQIDEDWEPAR